MVYLPMFTEGNNTVKMQNNLSNCLAYFTLSWLQNILHLNLFKERNFGEKYVSFPLFIFLFSVCNWKKYCLLTVINIHKFDIQVRKEKKGFFFSHWKGDI